MEQCFKFVDNFFSREPKTFNDWGNCKHNTHDPSHLTNKETNITAPKHLHYHVTQCYQNAHAISVPNDIESTDITAPKHHYYIHNDNPYYQDVHYPTSSHHQTPGYRSIHDQSHSANMGIYVRSPKWHHGNLSCQNTSNPSHLTNIGISLTTSQHINHHNTRCYPNAQEQSHLVSTFSETNRSQLVRI